MIKKLLILVAAMPVMASAQNWNPPVLTGNGWMQQPQVVAPQGYVAPVPQYGVPQQAIVVPQYRNNLQQLDDMRLQHQVERNLLLQNQLLQQRANRPPTEIEVLPFPAP